MDFILLPTLYDYSLTDNLDAANIVTKEDAEKLFSYFKNQPLFKWQDSNNGCEARADAVCVLLVVRVLRDSSSFGLVHQYASLNNSH